ncbi:MAG: SAM-dependent methyltransferase [Ilumatobacteraceae bacterium]
MPSAADQITAAIHAAEGAIPFSEFMRLALYGESGFYSQSGRAGRRGDFITSPEVGPLFGAVLARALDAWWHELGEPSEFTFVDAGAGPGTLARSVLAANPACLDSLRYIAVESSPVQRKSHPQGIESRSTMPDQSFVGVVVANELLDNLPFELFIFDGQWKQAFVEEGDDGRFMEVLRQADVPKSLPKTATHGARVPIQTAANQWVSNTRALIGRGRLVVFDYCTATNAELVARPWREWLRTFRQHERGVHYLLAPGEQDITSQIVIEQLPQPTSVNSQAEILGQWGIEDLVDEGRRYWSAQKGAPDLIAMKMRSRVSEAEALLDENGLGTFKVLQWQH